MTDPTVPEHILNDKSDIPRDVGVDSSRHPLEIVLSEFGDEIRRGGSPTIDDYAARYPHLVDEIRELLPVIYGLEQWKTDRETECLRRNVPAQMSLQKLGDYQLVTELGRGGMGVVFQAVHGPSQRSVAIKLLPWRFAADMPVWKDRLHREAATIAALQHPNIVPIYSFSEDQGYSFYVMQLIDGIGLDKIIKGLQQQRKAIKQKRQIADPSGSALRFDSWRGFASICEQVALALGYSHERGVCHNDIKPSNLLVRANRQVIVTDFGIGRLDPQGLSNLDDRAIGTLKYMAPERLTRSGGPPSDIYSLGVTLYELATQSPIFEFEKRIRLIDAICYDTPVPPRQRVPGIPIQLELIILKAMAKKPADRYSTARDLAIDLRRFINRQSVHAARRSPWQRLIGICRSWGRHRQFPLQ